MAATSDESELWHRRLSHINERDLAKVHKHTDGVPPLHNLGNMCRACRLGKAHKLPFPGQFERIDLVAQVVLSDIVVPVQMSFFDRFRYVSTFLNDHSRYLFIGLREHKSDIAQVFDAVSDKLVKFGGGNSAPNFSITVERLRSDGAKEYTLLKND